MPKYRRCVQNCGTLTDHATGLCYCCLHAMQARARNLEAQHQAKREMEAQETTCRSITPAAVANIIALPWAATPAGAVTLSCRRELQIKITRTAETSNAGREQQTTFRYYWSLICPDPFRVVAHAAKSAASLTAAQLHALRAAKTALNIPKAAPYSSVLRL